MPGEDDPGASTSQSRYEVKKRQPIVGQSVLDQDLNKIDEEKLKIAQERDNLKLAVEMLQKRLRELEQQAEKDQREKVDVEKIKAEHLKEREELLRRAEFERQVRKQAQVAYAATKERKDQEIINLRRIAKIPRVVVEDNMKQETSLYSEIIFLQGQLDSEKSKRLEAEEAKKEAKKELTKSKARIRSLEFRRRIISNAAGNPTKIDINGYNIIKNTFNLSGHQVIRLGRMVNELCGQYVFCSKSTVFNRKTYKSPRAMINVLEMEIELLKKERDSVLQNIDDNASDEYDPEEDDLCEVQAEGSISTENSIKIENIEKRMHRIHKENEELKRELEELSKEEKVLVKEEETEEFGEFIDRNLRNCEVSSNVKRKKEIKTRQWEIDIELDVLREELDIQGGKNFEGAETRNPIGKLNEDPDPPHRRLKRSRPEF